MHSSNAHPLQSVKSWKNTIKESKLKLLQWKKSAKEKGVELFDHVAKLLLRKNFSRKK